MTKAAIVGAGFIADYHAASYRAAPGVTLCAVADVDTARAGAMAASYGARAYADIGAMMGAERPDVVSVCVPTFLHQPIALAAIAGGAHVLVEKPFALSLAECARMALAARKAGRLLMVGQVLRFWPEYRALAALHREGSLGETLQIQAARLLHASRGGWFQEAGESGGALYDLHVHDVDYVLSLLGTDIESLWAVGIQEKSGAWRQISTKLLYRNGVGVQIDASNRMPKGYPMTAYFRLDGRDGTAEYRFRAPLNIERGSPSDTLFTVYANGEARPGEMPAPGSGSAQEAAFLREITEFCAAAKGEGENPIPAEESLTAMRLIHLIGESLRTGKRMDGVGARLEAPFPEEEVERE